MSAGTTINATAHRRVKVAESDELADGKSKVVHVEGRSLALFRINNEYYAIANSCLHRGGPLGEGEVSGHEVTCPWHGWKFNLVDGSFSMVPTLRVQTFKVSETPEGVFIEE
jgi:nitrite reductase (NADH) small subunit